MIMGKYKREYLEGLKMQDLRQIGYEFGCADTSKQELVEEILEAQGGFWYRLKRLWR